MRRSAYERILREMQQIRWRLDDIESSLSSWYPKPLAISESELLSLPDHLRKSYMIVASKGECTATEASNLTGRSRPAESNYLNQLARTGWLTKQRTMKKVSFRLVPARAIRQRVGMNADSFESQVTSEKKSLSEKRKGTLKTTPRTASVKCLSLDYDGTISPLDVTRSESRVPLETRVMLQQIGKLLPISIVTMKDLPFIVPRTPFAHGWSAIGGLEMKVGKRVLKTEQLDSFLPNISRAVNYAKSHISTPGVEVEEKQDLEGRTVAFCVDWRQARDLKLAKREVERVADYCRTLRLRLLTYKRQPYYDVYPVIPSKGKGLQEMLGELSVKGEVLYLGDSEIDNPAFRVSSISVGVIQGKTPPKTLDCEYFVKFERVSDFLKALIDHNFEFSSDFPMVMRNINRLKNDHGLDVERGPQEPVDDVHK